MRFAPALLPLYAASVAAQSQAPLLDQVKGWFAKATAAATEFAAQASPSIPNPASAGAAALASTQVETLTLDNFKQVLKPGAATSSPGIENWMVFVTGGNKTCYGHCAHAEEQWNRSVPALTVSKAAPQLALLDCEKQPVLCHMWSAAPPALYYMQLPQPSADQSQPATAVWYYHLNRTHVTSDQLIKFHTEEKYKEKPAYEGIFHPFDSPLAKAGVAEYAGYALWAFSAIPSWAFMIGISMLSRTFMSRRLNPQPPRAPPAGAQGGAPAAS